jgi:4'-phosphopantetheinyl transferase EntD
METIVPPCVAVVDTFGDVEAELYPEEQAAVARAVDKRRREFTTVRACARQAMARLGVDPAPIVPGPHGAPSWPAGVIGSMTHCQGYRASALALRRDVITIGVDAEPDAPLPEGVLASIGLPDEIAAVTALAASHPGVAWDRLLFSAKESVYKAWFPLTGTWLDFSEAEITFAPATQEFTATLLVPGPQTPSGRLGGFSGRWLTRQGILATAIVVTTAPPQPR